MTIRTCWICDLPIGPGEYSRDHIIPKSFARIGTRGSMRPAHKECNSARGNLAVEVVEALQTELRPFTALAIQNALIDARRNRHLAAEPEVCP